MPLTRFFFRFAIGLICLSILALLSNPAFASRVVMQTPFGEVEIELFDE